MKDENDKRKRAALNVILHTHTIVIIVIVVLDLNNSRLAELIFASVHTLTGL